MSNGITAMWDDAEHYQWLAKTFNERVRTVRGGHWPYDMDNKHYEELLEKHRSSLRYDKDEH